MSSYEPCESRHTDHSTTALTVCICGIKYLDLLTVNFMGQLTQFCINIMLLSPNINNAQ